MDLPWYVSNLKDAVETLIDDTAGQDMTISF